MLRLAQVELLGFKSFPHKTVFELDHGVTCVVGPNGSGKSNLADAINFAFGSQSGKELRANRLTSLIFAGTESIRPLNIASVTLHFEYTGQRPAFELAGDPEHAAFGDLSILDDAELEAPELPAGAEHQDVPLGATALPTAPDADTDGAAALGQASDEASAEASQPEAGHDKASAGVKSKAKSEARAQERTPTVLKLLQELQPGARLSLTRRVFRDGTAGYYINGDSVRLKDVDDLFNRFNLGRSAVFSISQGEVEKKILGTPQEMREWLAEATGVALLLAHKSRAQAKLKRTQQNLERLEDIRGNTRTLVADLAEQRRSAEEHLRLKQQLRAVELNEIRREVEYSQQQQQTAASALQEAKSALAEAKVSLEQVRSASATVHEQRSELDSSLAASERELSEATERQAQLKQEAALAQQAVTAHSSALERARHDHYELESQLGALNSDISRAEQQQKEVRTRLESAAASAGELAAAREAAQADVSAVLQRQSIQRSDLLEAAAQLARLNNQLEAAERHLRSLAGQLAAREQQAGAAGSRLALLEAELADEQQRSEACALALGQQREALEAHALELCKFKEQLHTSDLQVTELRRQLAELAARRQTLAELAEQSGQAAGNATLLADAKLGSQIVRVTDITFPPMYRAAFTRLLAHAGEALAGPRAGRRHAQSLLLDAAAEALWLDSDAELPGLLSDSLWRQLECGPELLAGLVSLFGDVLLADNADIAERLLATHPQVRWVVLSDGSGLLGRGHAYLGQPAPERALRVASRSDLAYLDSQLATAQSELESSLEQQLYLRDGQAQTQRLRDEAAAGVASAEAQLASQLALSDRLHKALEERRADLQLQHTQAEDLRAEQERTQAEQPRLAEQHTQARESLQRIEAAGLELAQELARTESDLNAVRQAEAEATAQRGLAEQQAQHLEAQLFDLAERRHNARIRLEQLAERISGHERGSAEAQLSGERALAEAAALVAQLAELAGRVEHFRQQRESLLHSLDEVQQELEVAAQRVSRAEQDAYRAETTRDRAIESVANWLEQLREKYNLSLSELLSDPAVTGEAEASTAFPNALAAMPLAQSSTSEAEPAEGDADSASEAEAMSAASSIDLLSDPHEASRYRLREAKWRINLALEELGPVNLLAIEQHAAQSERLSFLDTQAAELDRAAASLEQLIHDLDQGTEQRYGAALQQIEQRFGELFTTLFGGGSARLRFEDPQNVIESGVEVEVQLPGSRRMALRSLSGGQRSLIFLALFFAVHSVRSPGFCILDEADAALDDANVKRYTQLIERFCSEEQFIVVTHNKLTMEVADRLIGVVGRPKGVSNLLAVDLKKAQKLAEQKAGAA